MEDSWWEGNAGRVLSSSGFLAPEGTCFMEVILLKLFLFPLWAGFATDLTYFEVFSFSDKTGTGLSLDNITVDIRDKLHCWYKQVPTVLT